MGLRSSGLAVRVFVHRDLSLAQKLGFVLLPSQPVFFLGEVVLGGPEVIVFQHEYLLDKVYNSKEELLTDIERLGKCL